ILSYSIILYHAYKPFVKRILLDENFQYCSLAVYFLVSRRVSISLLPFAIYAVFHTADYTRTVLLPAFAPQNTQLQEQLKSVTSRFRNQAMDYVSKVEVFGVFARLLLGLFVLRSTVFSILFYLHFLRMRYYMSPQMRKTLTGIYTRVDAFLLPPTAHSKVPPAVSKAYSTVKSILCQSKPNPSPSTHQ
ncbi:uncharacterized protein BYT42DRAFT_500865, partial [Radiomyces spectabilis]|uniref:uncharacterized protein n=1 Tax=Radiomyces spectabilis TaxID=64574 RepID=UPI002220B77E